jgi:hypothetical protein
MSSRQPLPPVLDIPPAHSLGVSGGFDLFGITIETADGSPIPTGRFRVLIDRCQSLYRGRIPQKTRTADSCWYEELPTGKPSSRVILFPKQLPDERPDGGRNHILRAETRCAVFIGFESGKAGARSRQVPIPACSLAVEYKLKLFILKKSARQRSFPTAAESVARVWLQPRSSAPLRLSSGALIGDGLLWIAAIQVSEKLRSKEGSYRPDNSLQIGTSVARHCNVLNGRDDAAAAMLSMARGRTPNA